MAPLIPEGETLGEKQKHFNKLVQDAVDNKQTNLTKINYDDSDIENLLKIHIASRTKNAEYIIEVLKCVDMLYVSTAIKQCTWLITDQQYAHIVNPQYLHAELFPHMLTRAVNKLLLHISLHLKDEKRVEAFYDKFKDISKQADRLLSNCSLSFIKHVIQSKVHISLRLYQRLCQRSVDFLPYYRKVKKRSGFYPLQAVLFLLKSNTDDFLNILDTFEECNLTTLSKKHTKILMKKCPTRILDNFAKHKSYIDLSIVAKYMKKEDIEHFILKHRENVNTNVFFSVFNHLKHFIINMSSQDRFKFVKTTFIEVSEQAMVYDVIYSGLPISNVSFYQWYEFAPFEVALNELGKCIEIENSPIERCKMLSILIRCARANLLHTKTLLEYYYEKCKNEPLEYKVQFVNDVITDIYTHNFAAETWNVLDKLFHSIGVYVEPGSKMQKCLQSIVLYKMLHNENIQDVVLENIDYEYFEILYENKLNEVQKDKMYSFVITSISKLIQIETITNEEDFISKIYLLGSALDYIIKLKKHLRDYTLIRKKIQAMAKLCKVNSWEHDFSWLYELCKPWRRNMFEESIMLWPSEDVCIHALNDSPKLLDQHHNEVSGITTKHPISLRRFLTKLRVYWPDSLAQEWRNAYLNSIDNNPGNKTLVKGLLVLLPPRPLKEMATKYAMNDSNLNEPAKSLL